MKLNKKMYSKILCVASVLCLRTQQTSTFPMYPSAVFIFPQQNFLPQIFPVPPMSPFRTAANSINLFRNAPSFASSDFQSSASSDQKQEINGHQNPFAANSNESKLNEAGAMQENILSQDYQDQDSISIDAATQTFPQVIPVIAQDPDGRFSIGQVIMAVPWLPFEVNVPDTIAWMYNGISSIIGGIGQRIPFINRPADEPRPYSAMNQMQGRRPLFVPIRMVHVPFPLMNMKYMERY